MLVFFNFLFGIQHDVYHIEKLEFALLYSFLSISIHYYYPKLISYITSLFLESLLHVPILVSSSPDFLNSMYIQIFAQNCFLYPVFISSSSSSFFLLFYIHKNFILHLGSKSNFIYSWNISLVLYTWAEGNMLLYNLLPTEKYYIRYVCVIHWVMSNSLWPHGL